MTATGAGSDPAPHLLDDSHLEIAEVLRATLAGTTGPQVLERLERFGWRDLLASDPDRGAVLLFGAMGATGALAPLLSEVMAVDAEVGGVGGVGVVVPTGADPQGLAAPSAPGGMGVSGVLWGPSEPPEHLLVAGERGDQVGVHVVPAALLTLTPVSGLCPELGVVRVTGDASGPAGTSTCTPEGWRRAVRRGRLALAALLVANGQRALDLATEHAGQRVQFGRAVGSFQAVAHLLAEVHAALEAARGALDAALADLDPLGAMVAKSMAGRAGAVALRHGLQVLGGIGFTEENDLHHLLRRTVTFDAVLGSHRDLPVHIGRELQRREALPTLVEL